MWPQKVPRIQFLVYDRSKTFRNGMKPDINWLVETLWMFSNNFHKQDIYAVALVPENTYLCVKKRAQNKVLRPITDQKLYFGPFWAQK